MAYRWTPTPPVTPEVATTLGLEVSFASQSEAERWLTVEYAELAEGGVQAVTLYEEDRLVYGPMSLEA
ncbi:MAG: hypothetical protein WAS07_03430 [Micropruina sp.]|nr:hypothetical protein [Micropruina sp.]